MNRYKLSKAGINATEGIQRCGGDVEQYERFLKRFLEDPHFQALCGALAAQDAAGAFAAAHALKGVAGNLSMNRLYGDLYPLVEELRAGRLANADALLPPVAQDYRDILAALGETA